MSRTTKWGPSCWIFLHNLVHNYPDEKPTEQIKNCYKSHFILLGKLLPCKYCRESYEIFFKQIPIDPYLNSKWHLSYWLYLIHNRVNEKLNRQSKKNLKKSPNFIAVYNKYESYRSK
jgi:hypothetical protein